MVIVGLFLFQKMGHFFHFSFVLFEFNFCLRIIKPGLADLEKGLLVKHKYRVVCSPFLNYLLG